MKWHRVVILYIASYMIMAAPAVMTICRVVYKMTTLGNFMRIFSYEVSQDGHFVYSPVYKIMEAGVEHNCFRHLQPN